MVKIHSKLISIIAIMTAVTKSRHMHDMIMHVGIKKVYFDILDLFKFMQFLIMQLMSLSHKQCL